MASPIVIGVDLGTSACKAIAVDADGEVVAKATSEYPSAFPHPGWVEQSPEDWWRGTREAIKGVVEQLPSGAGVQGIGLCGQMHALVALDEHDEVLRPAILWNDGRNEKQCDWIMETTGGLEGLLELSQNRMLPGFTGGKIIWFRDEEPELYERMTSVLNPKDYIRLKMTGERLTDVSDASGTGLFDVRNRTWSDALLERIGIDRQLLPDAVESIEQTGGLLDDVARDWGLEPGLPVFGGGGDAIIQTTSMGLIDPGPVGFTLGTAGIIAGGMASCPEAPDGRVQVSCGNAPGRWHVMACTLNGAGTYQWLRDAAAPLLGDAELEYSRLNELAAAAPAGAGGLRFVPYVYGERAPHVAPAATGAWLGLTPGHGAPELVRSVLEGILLNMREALEICADTGLRRDRVLVSGGATNDDLWLSLLADVLGQEVVTVVGAAEGGAYGAAMAAGVGVGRWSDLEEAAGRVREDKTYTPDPERTQVYEEVFAEHRALCAQRVGAG